MNEWINEWMNEGMNESLTPVLTSIKTIGEQSKLVILNHLCSIIRARTISVTLIKFPFAH